MTTYYVSSEIGSNNNAGTSESAPLSTLQAAANLVQPGDTVEVMNGTYTSSGDADVLVITTSGTAAAPIVFEAAPGATPVINSSGVWNGINISASYITINGFTVVGDAANYSQSYALANASTDDPTLDGNGIAINSAPWFGPGGGTALPNHIIIENNTVYNEPGGGISAQGADYVQILNNNVHDNAHWSAFGNSGISIGSSQNLDNGPSPHIIIEGNTSVNNAEMVPTFSAGAITDGEGIILDTNPGYTGGYLVQGNTTSGNSGPGIEVNDSENAVVTGNTTQGDLTNPNLVSEGELFNNQSTNVIFTNNTTTNIPAPPAPPPGELVVNGTFETGNFTGWTESGNDGPLSGDPNQPQLWITQAAHAGNNAAAFGAINSDATISQTLTTVVGQTYTFDFWLANLGGGPNDFTAEIGGVTELHLVNAAAQPYTEYSYTYTATSTSTTLEFDAMQQPAQWDLDDVSVAPTGSGATTSGPPAGSTTSSPPAGSTTSDPGSTTTASPPPSSANLVANGNFATGDFTGWTLGGNSTSTTYGPEIYTDTNAQGGSTYAAGMGSVGSDGTLSQTIATTAGQTYTLSFWLQNEASGTQNNDFNAIWNGQTLLSLTNAAQSGYTEYTYTVTATSSTTTLEFSAANVPSQWDLDNISLTPAGSTTSTPPAGSTTTASPPPSGANLVANGNFATGDFTGWTLGGNSTSTAYGPEIYTDTNAQGGSTYAAGMGSVGSDGTLSQTIATTAGQTYTLSFWLQNEASGTQNNDFNAIWNGQTLLSLTNAARSGYTEYTYTVTATSSTTTLEFSAANVPSQWDLDNISLTPADSTTTPTAAPIQSGAVNIVGTDPTVTLTGTAPDGATVTVSDGGSTPLGTTTASSSGAWSFTTPDLPAGNYAFTVTDTTPTGTTTTSKPFDVTVPTPSAGGGASGLPRIAFDPPSTLGSWSNSNQTGSTSSFADIALLGSHIASSFALPSGSYGGTMVNSESTAFGTQPLVANPHHA